MRGLVTILAGVMLVGSCAFVCADDAASKDLVIWRGGKAMAGEIVGMNETFLRIKVKLLANQPAAILSIPRREVIDAHFAPKGGDEALLLDPSAAGVAEIRKHWEQKRQFLTRENSNAGAFGLALGELLLASGKVAEVREAEAIFDAVKMDDWDGLRRALAQTAKLRAMIARGNAVEALAAAEALAKDAEDPSVLIEARYVMGNAALQSLELLLEENPRWQDDERVRPERNRLYHESLDLLLFPYLFFGTEERQVARGLWRAGDVYRLAGERSKAREAAADIVALYPETPEAKLAEEFLASDADEKGGES